MTTYVVRRLLYAVLTFWGITVATFVLIHSVPGDPITYLLSRRWGQETSAQAIAALRHEYHLDEPLPKQYIRWVRGVVTLDFGRSMVDRRPVTERVFEKIPNSLLLNFIAFVLAAAIGVPVGLWSAARSGRVLERGSAVFFFLLYSLPTFWVGLLLMELFSVKLQWLPLLGMTSDDATALTAAQQFADRARHLVLPVITLAYADIAIFARFTKSSLTEVIRQDFITTARAKGLNEAGVMLRHAFRNALIPLVTLLGLIIPSLISGSVIVETIFQWDGIGRLYYDSILARDYPTVLGLTVATAVATLLGSLLADMLYAIADPRIRVGEKAR